LLDLTHPEAVKVLKMAVEAKMVTAKILEGSETSSGVGNFTPSWKFWLSLPQ
jgi:ligand of Numb protein X 1/2